MNIINKDIRYMRKLIKLLNYYSLWKDGFCSVFSGEDVQTKKPRIASASRERDYNEGIFLLLSKLSSL